MIQTEIVFFLALAFFFKIQMVASTPVLVNQIPDQTVIFPNPFNFSVPSRTFESSGEIFSLNVNSTSIPQWLRVKLFGDIFEIGGGNINTSSEVYVHQIFVLGNYLYIAEDDDGFSIYDISNRSNPIKIASKNTTKTTVGVFVDGNYLYIADWWYGENIKIFDISNKSNPILVSSIWSHASRSVVVSGNYLYNAANYFGILIYDISDKSNPIEKPTVTGNYSKCVCDVFVAGNFLYTADGDGFRIFNILNKSNPILIAKKEKEFISEVLDIFVLGNYLYIP